TASAPASTAVARSAGRDWRCGSAGLDICHVQIRLDQVAADHVPTVSSLHRGTAAIAQPPPELAVREDGEHGVREVLRVVPDERILAVGRVETFAPDRRGDNGLAHRPRIEDLQPGSTAHL